jgi:hypothetical protein
VDAATVAKLNRMNDYDKTIPTNVEKELADMMTAMNCVEPVDDYIDADDDEPVENDEECIERVDDDAVEEEDDDMSGDESDITPSEALACCLRLSTFLSRLHDSDDVSKKLSSVTQHVRTECMARRTQSTIDSFFSRDTDHTLQI